MKKLISVFIITILLIGMLPAIAIPAAAEFSGTTGDCNWVLNGTELTITGSGRMGDYTITTPSPWGAAITKVTIGEGVTGIGKATFFNCRELSEVIIPESLIAIGKDAFFGCLKANTYITDLKKWIAIDFADSTANPIQHGLRLYLDGTAITNLTIPDGVEIIRDYAFAGYEHLLSVTISNTVTSIGKSAFDSCSGLRTVSISSSVKTIGDWAFDYCTNLKSITIPSSVTDLGKEVFADCHSLMSIHVDEGNDLYESVDGALFDESKTTLLYCPAGKSGVYTIPDGVVTIEEGSFYGCKNITSVIMGDSVTTIGKEAFYTCENLESVTFGGDLTSIGRSAFSYCHKLTSLNIPGSVQTIGRAAFSPCNHLSSLILSDGVASIGEEAFRGCSRLTSVEIPGSVETIGTYAFDRCSGLTSVTIGDGVKNISLGAFSMCPELTSVFLSDSVKTIGASAFISCSKLKTLVLGSGLTTIKYAAFNGCNQLTTIWYTGTIEQWQSIDIETSNSVIQSSRKYYDSCPIGAPHAYDDACDAFCNKCQKERVAPHQYENDCDSICNGCQKARVTGPHQFDHVCDTACNSCGLTREVPPHQYKNDCDPTCNKCQGARLAPHQYDNVCDPYCNYCGVYRGTGHSFGEYVYNNNATAFENGTKTRTCPACKTTETIPVEGTKWSNPFSDVGETKYYYESVLWAERNDITNGLTATTFGPGNKCTRGQIVTFLWRAAGSPEPKSATNPFTDVSADKFYYKAVLWAAENGITTGTSATTFSPGSTCTRAQVVTFLWRAKGSPKAEASNPFADVKKGFYVDAVAWAVKNNITSGINATQFAPNNTCTRGQIVTFLFRAYKD